MQQVLYAILILLNLPFLVKENTRDTLLKRNCIYKHVLNPNANSTHCAQHLQFYKTAFPNKVMHSSNSTCIYNICLQFVLEENLRFEFEQDKGQLPGLQLLYCISSRINYTYYTNLLVQIQIQLSEKLILGQNSK